VTYGRSLPAGDSRPTRHPTRLACQAAALVGCAGPACRTRSGHRDRAASCRRSGPHRHHADPAVIVSGGGGGALHHELAEHPDIVLHAQGGWVPLPPLASQARDVRLGATAAR
jgi:hypothetical protein